MTPKNSAPDDSFARRIRAHLGEKNLTLAQLAERAELDPTLVSKLLTESDAARREPKLDHILAIARALEERPRELVMGTAAETTLGEWVPRAELERESENRSDAQAEAAALRTEVAGMRAEVASIRTTNEQLSQQVATASRRLGELETSARKEQASLRVAKDVAEAKLAAAIAERDQALAQAAHNYQAWSNARSQILQVQREAKGSAWVAALLGAAGGAVLGAAAVEPTVATAPRRRRKQST